MASSPFAFSDDAALVARARAVLGGTALSEQAAGLASPRLYVSGAFAGRTVRGEIHELRDVRVDASGAVVPPPVLLGRLFEVIEAGAGSSKEVEIEDDKLDVFALVEAYTADGEGEAYAYEALRDMLSATGQPQKVDDHTCYIFHFPNLAFQRAGAFRLKFCFFERSSLPESPGGGRYVVQAKCAGRDVLVVPPLRRAAEGTEGGEAA
ncbi:hypothetical protein HDZ31DRAFT_60112 [Schizophyllum fasciatum]